jgi:biopolymer transport protein ExbB/TolQ/phage gpG-like protein
MSLMAGDELSGKAVRCPGCSATLEIPAFSDEASSEQEGLEEGGGGKKRRAVQRTQVERSSARTGWKEEDPTNPKAWLSFGIGMGLTLVWFAIVYRLQAPPGKAPAEFTSGEFLANLFFKHFTVSFANTLFFCWAMAICFLKFRLLSKQRRALILDVLPVELGKEITSENVGAFIDRLYELPLHLRDSLMTNRVRKGLELFEVRPNVSDLTTMMESRANVDAARVAGSYILVKAFLWAIPLLGFIGTVVGLSHAIGGMNFSNGDDLSQIVGSLNAVVSNLGTAFDATLLGLVYAVVLNFTMNPLGKHEEEVLTEIESYCNEMFLPRLKDGLETGDENVGEVGDAVVKAITNAQSEFLGDLNALSARLLEYTENLDRRTEEHQQVVASQFVETMDKMRSEVTEAISGNLRAVSESESQQKAAVAQYAETTKALQAEVAKVLKESSEGARRVDELQKSVVTEFGQTMKEVRANLEESLEKVAKDLERRAEEQQRGVASQFVETLSKMRSEVTEAISGNLRAVSESVSQSELQQRAAVAQYAETTKALQAEVARVLKESAEGARRVDELQKSVVAEFGQSLKDLRGKLDESLSEPLKVTAQCVAGVEAGLRGLNQVLAELGEKKVVVEVKRRSWFGLGS